MESASVMGVTFVNALSGMAFAPTEAMAVFGVVPLVVPRAGRRATRGRASRQHRRRSAQHIRGRRVFDAGGQRIGACRGRGRSAERSRRTSAARSRRGARLNVQRAEIGRILLPLRRCLQNHVVLVELRVQRVDLALAVGVVERVVDRPWAQCRAAMPSRDQFPSR